MTAILVTGGAGFIGSHFVRAAAEAGHHVVVLDDLSTGTALPSPMDAAFVHGDIADRALVARVIRRHDISCYVHFAGKICVGESIESPRPYFDHNIARTLRGCSTSCSSTRRARSCSRRRRLSMAPIRVHTAPASSPSRRCSTPTAKRTACRGRLLRYHNAAGAHPDGTLREAHDPETHLIPLAIDAALGRRPPLIVFGDDHATRDGTCVRDYVHVCDLARAHLVALEKLERGEQIGVIDLGSGIGYTVRVRSSAAAARVLGALVPFTMGQRRAGDVSLLTANTSRARERSWAGTRSAGTWNTILEDTARSRR